MTCRWIFEKGNIVRVHTFRFFGQSSAFYDPTKLSFIFSTPSPLRKKFIELRDQVTCTHKPKFEKSTREFRPHSAPAALATAALLPRPPQRSAPAAPLTPISPDRSTSSPPALRSNSPSSLPLLLRAATSCAALPPLRRSSRPLPRPSQSRRSSSSSENRA